MKSIIFAALAYALLLREEDKGDNATTGSNRSQDRDLNTTGPRANAGGRPVNDPFADQDRQRDRQKSLAERTLAAQRAAQAAALAVETDTELTTVEHSGKRTGEPDKPDELEDIKVGEAFKTEEVQTEQVERQTLGGKQAVDVRVTSPEPNADVAAAMAARPEGSNANPILAAGATGTGTRAQQADARKLAEDAGGVDPAAEATGEGGAEQGTTILPSGKEGKPVENPNESGPGHQTL